MAINPPEGSLFDESLARDCDLHHQPRRANTPTKHMSFSTSCWTEVLGHWSPVTAATASTDFESAPSNRKPIVSYYAPNGLYEPTPHADRAGQGETDGGPELVICGRLATAFTRCLALSYNSADGCSHSTSRCMRGISKRFRLARLAASASGACSFRQRATKLDDVPFVIFNLRNSRMKVVKRYASIQVLRAFAAMGVVATHTSGGVSDQGWIARLIPHLTRYGEIGVDVFFVISGFVIALVAYGEPAGLSSAKRFLSARIARVVPLYWVLTALFLALPVISTNIFGEPETRVWYVISSFFFLPSFLWSGLPPHMATVLYVGWTLIYEAWFYVVFASAMIFTRRPLIVVAAFLCLTSVLRLTHSTNTLFLVYTDPIVLEFVAGCFLGAYYARGNRVELPQALVVLCFALIVRAAYAPTLTDTNRFIVFGVPAFALVVTALAIESRVRWGSWLESMGDASYALYLTQVFTVPLVLKGIETVDARHRLPGDGVTVAVIIVAIFIAVPCHRLLERPLIRFVRNKLTRRTEASISQTSV